MWLDNVKLSVFDNKRDTWTSTGVESRSFRLRVNHFVNQTTTFWLDLRLENPSGKWKKSPWVFGCEDTNKSSLLQDNLYHYKLQWTWTNSYRYNSFTNWFSFNRLLCRQETSRKYQPSPKRGSGEVIDQELSTPACSPIHPRLLGQSRFKPCLGPSYFLLQSSDCVLEICMLLAGRGLVTPVKARVGVGGYKKQLYPKRKFGYLWSNIIIYDFSVTTKANFEVSYNPTVVDDDLTTFMRCFDADKTLDRSLLKYSLRTS